ncbi:hypothetical protein N7519_007452 [Penicillium mononematosum]|uniref:uncharacterized protein n=1 Tax=Penicillium mononematosum TaxID=268346 RepID=UPI002548FDE7|nr:uncharacterized protein N7519_007452 [Penicillium mononematosum]KAJ6186151.1 hypothetical protein N7519_007452 [Penicillium mononematosum]
MENTNRKIQRAVCTQKGDTSNSDSHDMLDPTPTPSRDRLRSTSSPLGIIWLSTPKVFVFNRDAGTLSVVCEIPSTINKEASCRVFSAIKKGTSCQTPSAVSTDAVGQPVNKPVGQTTGAFNKVAVG